MTYFLFLGLFLGIPLSIMVMLTIIDCKKRKSIPEPLTHLRPWIVLLIHIFLALSYTTPWDNYLVATGVWFYDTKLVTGITIGWVPVEEYIFFILQTTLTCLWIFWLARRKSPHAPLKESRKIRFWLTLILLSFWLPEVGILISGFKPAWYLALIIVWALPPIMLQTGFGGDILWHYRTILLLSIVPVTLYLGLSDSMAIHAGTWAVDPAQSTKIFILNKLPLEELLFFFMTNVVISFGTILFLSKDSRTRADIILKKRRS